MPPPSVRRRFSVSHTHTSPKVCTELPAHRPVPRAPRWVPEGMAWQRPRAPSPCLRPGRGPHILLPAPCRGAWLQPWSLTPPPPTPPFSAASSLSLACPGSLTPPDLARGPSRFDTAENLILFTATRARQKLGQLHKPAPHRQLCVRGHSVPDVEKERTAGDRGQQEAADLSPRWAETQTRSRSWAWRR